MLFDRNERVTAMNSNGLNRLAENAVLYQGTTLVVPQLIENTSGCHEWPV
jgi:hypothetical protein